MSKIIALKMIQRDLESIAKKIDDLTNDESVEIVSIRNSIVYKLKRIFDDEYFEADSIGSLIRLLE